MPTDPTTYELWMRRRGQVQAEQKVRREEGMQILPWVITRQFWPIANMHFSHCQYIAGEPSSLDICKCSKATGTSRVYCSEHEMLIAKPNLSTQDV